MDIIIGEDRKVIATGTVLCPENTPIIFVVPGFQELRFIFTFSRHSEYEKFRYITSIDGKALKVTFYNWDDITGSGNTTDWSIGYNNTEKLYLSFRINAKGATLNYVFHYTFYTTKKQELTNV